MKIWNLNPSGNKYYRQNNNLIKPSIRCKPTATVEGLDIAGWPLPQGSYSQPEDNLTAFMESTYGENSPENWESIRMAINGHFLPGPKPVTGPRWNWTIQEALYGLTKGLPFIASTWLTKGGHVVVIVGFTTDDENTPKEPGDIDLTKVRDIIIDDPYGDRTSGTYDTRKSGHNNRYKKDFFIADLWRGVGIQIKRNV